MINKDTYLMKNMDQGFEEIELGNAVIAKFMGLVKDDKGLYKFSHMKMGYTDLYFHSNIEWIYPVLDKIERHGFDSAIMRMKIDDTVKYSCKIRKEKIDPKADSEAHVIDTCKITALWKAVVKFCSTHEQFNEVVNNNLKTV